MILVQDLRCLLGIIDSRAQSAKCGLYEPANEVGVAPNGAVRGNDAGIVGFDSDISERQAKDLAGGRELRQQGLPHIDRLHSFA